MTLNKNGMELLSVGGDETRSIKNTKGQMMTVHSLQSCNYLKVAPENHLFFGCSKPGFNIISVNQEQMKNKKDSIVTF